MRAIRNGSLELLIFHLDTGIKMAHVVAQLVEALHRFPMVSLDFFHWHKSSGSTVALGSTQPLTEMSTRNISWRLKAAGSWD